MQRPSSSHNAASSGDPHSRRHRQHGGSHTHTVHPGASLGMPNFKYRQQYYDIAPKGQAAASAQERLES